MGVSVADYVLFSPPSPLLFSPLRDQELQSLGRNTISAVPLNTGLSHSLYLSSCIFVRYLIFAPSFPKRNTKKTSNCFSRGRCLVSSSVHCSALTIPGGVHRTGDSVSPVTGSSFECVLWVAYRTWSRVGWRWYDIYFSFSTLFWHLKRNEFLAGICRRYSRLKMDSHFTFCLNQ